mmetsp:Transcript_43075/g.119124  ORF Transcript_43075/g.119124 Transcript_43075/m.119124 type:complete len:334 (+) Transcript_43075:1056-2057(+)
MFAQAIHHWLVSRSHCHRLGNQLLGLFVVRRHCAGKALVEFFQFWRGEDKLHFFDGQRLVFGALRVLYCRLVFLRHPQRLPVRALNHGDCLLATAACQTQSAVHCLPDHLHLIPDLVALGSQLLQRRVEGAVNAKRPLLNLLEIDCLLHERAEVPEILDAGIQGRGDRLRQHFLVGTCVSFESGCQLGRAANALVYVDKVLDVGFLSERFGADAVQAGCDLLEVGDMAEESLNLSEEPLCTTKGLHHVMAVADLLCRSQRLRQPLPEAPRAQDRTTPVEETKNRRARPQALVWTGEHVEGGERRLVEVHKTLQRIDAEGARADVRGLTEKPGV